jgi:hypothetical protein
VFCVRRDRVVAETIEPAQGRDPNITFAIFEERGNEIAGEPISLRKYVNTSLVEMHHTGTRCSNPDAAIAILKKHYSNDIACRTGVRTLRYQFPALESSEPSRQRNQKRSIASLA